MTLSKEDIELFYKLNPALLVYVNITKKLSNISTVGEFVKVPISVKVELRNALYENIEIIESFVSENPFDFAPDELEIIKNWKYFIKGKFYLMQHLKNYSVLMSADYSTKAYGVLSISDNLADIIPNVPIIIDTVLLPFKDQVIYDGFFFPYGVSFGRGIRQSLNSTYQIAKANFGIITTLPFSIKQDKDSKVDKLKFYLKNEKNQRHYYDEIWDLIHGDSHLLEVYHQEMGKTYARKYSKRLSELGFVNTWFAILEGLIVASGKTKDDLEDNLKSVLPPHKRIHTYTFRLK